MQATPHGNVCISEQISTKVMASSTERIWHRTVPELGSNIWLPRWLRRCRKQYKATDLLAETRAHEDLLAKWPITFRIMLQLWSGRQCPALLRSYPLRPSVHPTHSEHYEICFLWHLLCLAGRKEHTRMNLCHVPLNNPYAALQTLVKQQHPWGFHISDYYQLHKSQNELQNVAHNHQVAELGLKTKHCFLV